MWHNDPMSAIEQLPVVNVPVRSLVPAFYVRQAGTDPAHVRLLADAGPSIDLPAILVQKHGSRIVDGMHRLEVAKLRGQETIRARIVDCSDGEALILAVRSNTLHGLPLSKADRISGAIRILAAHPGLSDRALAGLAGLSPKSIASLRNSGIGNTPSTAKRVGRDGRRRPAVTEEGRVRAAEYMRANPEASLREVAQATDVSLGTAHSVRERLRQGLTPEAGSSQSRALLPIAASSAASFVKPLAAIGRRNVKLSWLSISAKLAGDPTLRYTSDGRAFLRWMSLHSMRAEEWREFVDAIPERWVDEVAGVAASMSEEWNQYAQSLRAKQEEEQ
jgi:ParB-like chromosome segregation protein Spo0J